MLQALQIEEVNIKAWWLASLLIKASSGMEYERPFTLHNYKSTPIYCVCLFSFIKSHHTPIAFRMGDYYDL